MKKLLNIFKIVFVATVIIYSSSLNAQTPDWKLLAHTSGISDEYIYACSAGPLGNVYYIGSAQGAFSVNGIPVKYYSNMFGNGFIGHNSPSGNNNWAISVGGNALSFASLGGLTTDPFGNIFFRVNCFGGVIGDTLRIGSTYHKLLTRTEGITLVVKMDSLGNVLWTNEINPGATAPGIIGNMDMISDMNGDLYLTGYFFEPQVFDTITILPIGLDANFIAKCSANGNFLWAKSFGCKGGDGQVFKINRNNQNELYVSGGWEGDTLFIDGQYVVNPTPGGFFNTDRYIAKFSTSGAVQWVKREGSIDSDDVAVMAVMDNGDVICQSLLGANPLTVNNNQTITGGPSFLFTKYNSQGIFLSSHKIQIPTNSSASILTDGDDLYMSLNYSDPQITYGGVTLVNSSGILGTSDIAIFKLDAQYNVKWGVSMGNTENEFINGLSYSAGSGLILGGVTASNQLIVAGDTINNMGLLTSEGMVLTFDIMSVGISSNPISNNITYFPNPVKEIVYINIDEEVQSEIEVKVINTTAKVMLKESFNADKQISLDVKNLPKGMYILEIKMGNKYAVKKFIKE